MTRFNYIARDSSGQTITGSLTANSPAAVSRQLRQEGKFLVRLQNGASPAKSAGAATEPGSAAPASAGPASAAGGGSNKRIQKKDIIYLTTQLAVMTDTGVPLADALDAITEQTPNLRLQAVLKDIAERVKSGEEFSTVLARHPRLFSPMYVAMVRAAEASGKLGVMLDRVAEYLVDEYETRKKVTGALIYPCAMITFAITVTVFLMAFVLPRFKGIYEGKEAALPLPTLIVMHISNFIVGHWLLLLIATIAAAVGAVLFLRSAAGKLWWAHAKLRLPLLGGMFHKLYVTRCMRTLGTLIGTGVAMLESVQITRAVAGLGPYGVMWEQIDEALRGGQQLSEQMFKAKLLPRSVSQMIAAGERTGKLPQVLERVAAFADRDLKAQIKASTAMIEPVMIVVMGGIIGFVVMALLLPIFNISKVMSS